MYAGGVDITSQSPHVQTLTSESGELPQVFTFTDAARVLGLENNYSLLDKGRVPVAIYVDDKYYEVQPDYSYKQTAAGSQARSLITSGGIAVGTIYVTRKYGTNGLVSKAMGFFRGLHARIFPSTGKIATINSNGYVWDSMNLPDAIDVIESGDFHAMEDMGLENGYETEVTTPSGEKVTIGQLRDNINNPAFTGPLGLTAPVAGGVAAGAAVGAGIAAGGGAVGAGGSVITIGGTINLAPGISAVGLTTFPGTLTPLAGGAAVYTPAAAANAAAAGNVGAALSASQSAGLGPASSGGIFSSITSAVQSGLSAIGSAVVSAAHAIAAGATAVASAIAQLGAWAVPVVGAAVAGAIFGIRAIMTQGQDKIRDSRRIEEVNPYIFQIVDTYNSLSGNTIEEEVIFHAEAENAVLQLYQAAATKFERSESEASQSLYIHAYLHGGNVPGPDFERTGQMVYIAGMDSTFNQRMETHRRNLNFEVYEAADGTREAYPPQGSETGTSWGKVTVQRDSQGNVTNVVSETGQVVPMSVLASILAAEGSRLHTMANTLQVVGEQALTGRVGENYNHQIAKIGGSGPFTWSVSRGSLPGGISLNTQTGQLTGTPLRAGQVDFTLKITDSRQDQHEQAFTFYVDPAEAGGPGAVTPSTLTISQPDFHTATVGQEYRYQVVANGGSGGYVWTVEGILPIGMYLDASTGTIYGTPTQNGNYSFALRVTDSEQNTHVLPGQIILVNQPAQTQNYNPSVEFNNVNGGTAFRVGDRWHIRITNARPGATITATGGNLTASGEVPSDTTVLGTVNSQGVFEYTLNRDISQSEVGYWNILLKMDGQIIGNTLMFTVSSVIPTPAGQRLTDRQKDVILRRISALNQASFSRSLSSAEQQELNSLTQMYYSGYYNFLSNINLSDLE